MSPKPVSRRGAAAGPVRQILAYNQGREPERLALKYQAMRQSTLNFLRGSCHLFYARLPTSKTLHSAPLAWACGDLHVQNFGSYKGDNRLAYFDLNDFDEALLAPATWDPLRCLTSLRVAAHDGVWSPSQAEQMSQAFVASYGQALAAGKAYWVERETAQGPVRDLLDSLRNRPRAEFLDTRTVLKRRRRQLRVDGRHALPASEAQRAAVTAFMAGFAATRPDPDFYRVLDVARRIAGTGSLGVERYVVLVEGKGSPDGNYLLDLKRALPSSLAPRLASLQPAWPSEAHRIVALQQRMQAVSMAFLQPVQLEGQAYVLRGLQPTEDRLALDRARVSDADRTSAVETMGRLLGWSQLRSAGREGSATADALIAFGQRKKWRRRLLELSDDGARQVAADAQAFNQAFDGGLLNAR